MDTPRHSVSAAAIILDASATRVLLIKRRDNGRWEPPGGVVELEETIEAAVRREVLEGTGAEVEIGSLTGVYKNMPRGIVALVFRCRLLSEPQRQTNEAAAVEWRDIGDVPALLLPAYAARVLDALDGDVHVRAHDGINVREEPLDRAIDA